MKLSLTDREKRLLAILLIVALVFIPLQYLILPQNEKLQALKEEHKTLSTAYDIARNKDGFIEKIDADLTKYKKSLNKYTGKSISKHLSDEQLDKFFTDLCLKFNLKPKSLLIESANKDKDEKEQVTTSYKYIQTAYVTVTATGQTANLIPMMREMDALGYLNLVSLKTQQNAEAAEYTLGIKITMLAGG